MALNLTGFRRVWLQSGSNQPGGTYYSDDKKPTAVLIAPWFFFTPNTNPRGLNSGINVAYVRWATEAEPKRVSRIEVAVAP